MTDTIRLGRLTAANIRGSDLIPTWSTRMGGNIGMSLAEFTKWLQENGGINQATTDAAAALAAANSALAVANAASAVAGTAITTANAANLKADTAINAAAAADAKATTAQNDVNAQQPWIAGLQPSIVPSGLIDDATWSPKYWTPGEVYPPLVTAGLPDHSYSVAADIEGQLAVTLGSNQQLTTKRVFYRRANSDILLIGKFIAAGMDGSSQCLIGLYKAAGPTGGGTRSRFQQTLVDGVNWIYGYVSRDNFFNGLLLRPFVRRSGSVGTVQCQSLQAIEVENSIVPFMLFDPPTDGVTDALPAFTRALTALGTMGSTTRTLDLGGRTYSVSGPIENTLEDSTVQNGEVKALGVRADWVGGDPDSSGQAVQKGIFRLKANGQTYKNVYLDCGPFVNRTVTTANSTYTVSENTCNGFEDAQVGTGNRATASRFEDCYVGNYADFGWRYSAQSGGGFGLIRCRSRKTPPESFSGMMDADANTGAAVVLAANDGRVTNCTFLNGEYQIWQKSGGTMEILNNHPWLGSSLYQRRYFGTIGTVIETGIQTRTATQVGTYDSSKVSVTRRAADWQIIVTLLVDVAQADAVVVPIRRDEVCALMNGWGSFWEGNYLDGGTVRAGSNGLAFAGGFGLPGAMAATRGTYPPTMVSAFEFKGDTASDTPPVWIDWQHGNMGKRMIRYPRLGQTSYSANNARFSDDTLEAIGAHHQNDVIKQESRDASGLVSTFRSSGNTAATGIAHFSATAAEIVLDISGLGNPEGSVTAPVGSIYRRRDSDHFQRSIWLKTTGTGNTGWSKVATYDTTVGNLEVQNLVSGGTLAATFRSANGQPTASICIANAGTAAASSVQIFSINFNPEGALTAVVGSLALRRDGGAGTTLYVKESGSGNTGWVGK